MKHAASHRHGEHLDIDPKFAAMLNADDVFDACMNLKGEPVRQVEGRRTIRFSLNGSSFYAKIHTGAGWGEIVKNIVRFQKPVIGARDEQRAIEFVTRLGIRTTPMVAYGRRGRNPATVQSFIITEDVGPTISLEQLAEQAASDGINADLKRRLINQVAAITSNLHRNGLNHRDLYICHFEMDRSVMDSGSDEPGRLILMDLHRAQIRKRVPFRWVVKDLAALLFSSLDAPLTRRDLMRFARRYRGGSLRTALLDDARMWRQVRHRADRLYQSHFNRQPKSPAAQWVAQGR